MMNAFPETTCDLVLPALSHVSAVFDAAVSGVVASEKSKSLI
jgi:hypothetical protein